jgi:predicted secreted hydrolase
MTMRKLLLPLLAISLLAAGLAWYFGRKTPQAPLQASLVSAAPASSTQNFSRALAPIPFSFPEDHGPHPDFQTEWWYFTGNLESSDGQRFGYQLTFFRRALVPLPEQPERQSDWAANQVYLAHFALADVSQENYQPFERISRGAAGLSGAQSPPFQVWLEDWQVEETTPNNYRLLASQDGVSLDLQLNDLKGPILQGDQGYSQKGPEPGQASYYYSLPRLATSGTVTTPAKTYSVSGASWMDHEWSTSALAPEQVGWDWFSVQLDDQSELMFFQIRRADGSIDPYSSGIYIAPDGRTTPLGQQDFTIEVTDSWDSPHSGTSYPAGWSVNIPPLAMTLEIVPLLSDQEFTGSYTYWEGAVQVTGQQNDSLRTGFGYVELTGYSGSMGGKF